MAQCERGIFHDTGSMERSLLFLSPSISGMSDLHSLVSFEAARNTTGYVSAEGKISLAHECPPINNAGSLLAGFPHPLADSAGAMSSKTAPAPYETSEEANELEKALSSPLDDIKGVSSPASALQSPIAPRKDHLLSIVTLGGAETASGCLQRINSGSNSVIPATVSLSAGDPPKRRLTPFFQLIRPKLKRVHLIKLESRSKDDNTGDMRSLTDSRVSFFKRVYSNKRLHSSSEANEEKRAFSEAKMKPEDVKMVEATPTESVETEIQEVASESAKGSGLANADKVFVQKPLEGTQERSVNIPATQETPESVTTDTVIIFKKGSREPPVADICSSPSLADVNPPQQKAQVVSSPRKFLRGLKRARKKAARRLKQSNLRQSEHISAEPTVHPTAVEDGKTEFGDNGGAKTLENKVDTTVNEATPVKASSQAAETEAPSTTADAALKPVEQTSATETEVVEVANCPPLPPRKLPSQAAQLMSEETQSALDAPYPTSRFASLIAWILRSFKSYKAPPVRNLQSLFHESCVEEPGAIEGDAFLPCSPPAKTDVLSTSENMLSSPSAADSAFLPLGNDLGHRFSPFADLVGPEIKGWVRKISIKRKKLTVALKTCFSLSKSETKYSLLRSSQIV